MGVSDAHRRYGLIETKTATFADSNFVDTYKSGNYAQTHWQHSVGKPFCTLGAISYDITVRFYRSGTIEVVGEREPVPHHEAYGRWDSGSGIRVTNLIHRRLTVG